MANGIEIERNGLSVYVPRRDEESSALLVRRSWFIVKQPLNTKEDYDNAVKTSFVWANMKNGCVYSPTLSKKIENSNKAYFI